MYCGDETGAFIGDIGSHTCRFGYGGEDNPKYVVSSYVGYNEDQKKRIPTSCYRMKSSELKSIYRKADTNIAENKHQVDPTAYLQQGDIVEDWDAYEHAWRSSFDVLRVRDPAKHTTGGDTPSSTTTAPSGVTSSTIQPSYNSAEGKCVHPILVVDPGCTHVVGSNGGEGSQYDKAVKREQTAKLTEMLMESMNAVSMFVAPSPMLAAFSHGRQTCLVVDIGAGGTRVTPVVDGLLLRYAQRRSGRGGDWLGAVQQRVLQDDNITVQPRYQMQQKQPLSVKPSSVFHRWALQDVMYEMRTSSHISLANWRMDPTTPFVHPKDTGKAKEEEDEKKNTADAMAVDPNPEHTYELPDGTAVDMTTRNGKDLLRLPELFFTDDVPFVESESLSQESDHSVLSEHQTLSNLPLHKLIHSSLTAVGDCDARKELCGNIILSGASSLFPNMEQRLSLELTTIVPSTYKCRVIASRNSVERSCAAWIGGSVLTSLGSFQQLWLSRTEYEEYGANLATQRFP